MGEGQEKPRLMGGLGGRGLGRGRRSSGTASVGEGGEKWCQQGAGASTGQMVWGGGTGGVGGGGRLALLVPSGACALGNCFVCLNESCQWR